MMRRGLDFGLASSLVAVFALLACFSKPAAATNVSLSGAWSYESTGSTVVLRVDRITNHSTGGHSGTLRLELWAFATPYNGTSQQGYRLASYTLNPLSGGYHYPNLSTGSIAFTRPATGTWHIALLLMEYDGARYVTIDWLLSSAGQVMSCSGGTCTTSTPASSTPGTTTPAAASVSTNRSTYTVNAGESLVLSANLQAGSAAGSLADIYVQVQIEGGAPKRCSHSQSCASVTFWAKITTRRSLCRWASLRGWARIMRMGAANRLATVQP